MEIGKWKLDTFPHRKRAASVPPACGGDKGGVARQTRTSKERTANARALSTPPPTPPASGGGFTGTAFTLVELSVVLVIIGLLVGGVLAAQSMIRSAQVNQVVRDLQNYEAAIRLFKNKYGHIPGDMTNATDFWSSSSNGNGNRQLGMGSDGDGFRAWQHLALSGLIPGSYTGTAGSGGTWDAVIGENVPAGAVDGVGYTLYYPGSMSSNPSFFDGEYGNVMIVGKDNGSGESTYVGVFTPLEAYKIDKKLDGDGKPGTGRVRTYKGSYTHTSGCNTTTDPSTSEYDLNNDAGLCNIVYLLDVR